jgi:hypothetical protein
MGETRETTHTDFNIVEGGRHVGDYPKDQPETGPV